MQGHTLIVFLQNFTYVFLFRILDDPDPGLQQTALELDPCWLDHLTVLPQPHLQAAFLEAAAIAMLHTRNTTRAHSFPT